MAWKTKRQRQLEEQLKEASLFEPIICPKCGLKFSIQADFVQAHRDKGRAFYCPNAYCGGVGPSRLYFPNGQQAVMEAK